MSFATIIAVAVGGATGALMRYGLTHALPNSFSATFTTKILFINILGSLLLGFCFGINQNTNLLNSVTHAFLMTGLLSSFTTFSTFALENALLIEKGNYIEAIIYTALSVFISIAAFILGNYLIKQMV